MSKYYTPDISEFYVGFKYQIQRGFEDYYRGIRECIEMSAAYSHCQFQRTSDLTMIAHAIDSDFKEMIRVKYLDQSDIEELGFEYAGQDEVAKGVFYTDYNSTKDSYRITVEPNRRVEIAFCGSQRLTEFHGIIKNKSELKKVLKMIGYDIRT